MPPSGVELDIIVVGHVAKSGIRGKERISVDAATGVLLTVAGVESDTTVKIGMGAAIGLGRRDKSP